VSARAVLAQARLETRLLLRSSESLLVTLGIPLGVLVFFSLVPVLPTGDVDAVTFLVPGVLGLSATATGLVASAIQTAYERKSGALKLLGATPLGRAGFVTAKLASVLAILVVQSGLVMGLALAALGWRPAGGAVGVLLGAAGVLVAGLVMASLGLWLAGTLTAELTTAVTNALFLVLLMLGGVAVAPDVLPAGLAAVGAASPLGAAVTVLRTLLDGVQATSGGGAALVALVVWGALGTGLAVRTFRWEP
jgi:ABC-2 type transport system permease protein